MKLTICMPTYNRGTLLVTLIKTVLRTVGSILPEQDFEIVVSDNHSQDNTSELLKRLSKEHYNVRVVMPPKHFPTAEENLCFALGECLGDYIWILGDDDAIEEHSVQSLCKHVSASQYDLIIFNSRSHSHDGKLLKNVRIPCRSPELKTSLLDFVQKTGFWFVISGFSTTVVRRSSLDLSIFADIMEIGKIYSQVTWLIAQFHDKKFLFVNQPLVAYRQNVSDVKPTGHWENVAKREKLFPRAIWTNGFLKQLDYLVQKDIITRRFVSKVVDRNLDKRFYFVDEMFFHMINTTIEWLDKKQQPIPPEECSYFLSWMYDLWPNNICFIEAMEKLYWSVFNDASFDRATLDVAAGIINARAALPWYRHLHLYDCYGFSIYNLGNQWFAVKIGCDEEVGSYLEEIDAADLEDLLYVRSSEDELLAVLSKLPSKLRLETRLPNEQSNGTSTNLEVLELNKRNDVLMAEISESQSLLERTRLDWVTEVDELKRQVNMHMAQLLLHRDREIALESQVSALRSSTSWKLTKPVRAIAGIFK